MNLNDADRLQLCNIVLHSNLSASDKFRLAEFLTTTYKQPHAEEHEHALYFAGLPDEVWREVFTYFSDPYLRLVCRKCTTLFEPKALYLRFIVEAGTNDITKRICELYDFLRTSKSKWPLTMSLGGLTSICLLANLGFEEGAVNTKVIHGMRTLVELLSKPVAVWEYDQKVGTATPWIGFDKDVDRQLL
ncbi:hypothetical protein HK097_006056 [Rhizophlyctis rosea]|uniref:F-box domain-containing protein n=1 Tax=Rhizophlyctis rosea TaxID=64517 RepID=A0AAD5SG70_9FUNG|nr:hypothetical protein HK097_006056 [Rhizophlyctis rosea]